MVSLIMLAMSVLFGGGVVLRVSVIVKKRACGGGIKLFCLSLDFFD